MSDALTVDNAGRLEAIAVEIEAIQGVALLKIGERLMEARDLFKYDRDEGGFIGWIDARLKISKPTAYRMIDVFRSFGAANASHVETLSKSVLYALAGPSTPEPVREEAMRRVEAGEPVNLDTVMNLKRQLVDAKDQAKVAKQDEKVQRTEAQRVKDERDRVRNELDFANAKVRQQAEEIERLKQDGVIHFYPAEPAAASPTPIRPDPKPRGDCLRTAMELVSDRFDGDVAEVVALLRESGQFNAASELEAAAARRAEAA